MKSYQSYLYLASSPGAGSQEVRKHGRHNCCFETWLTCCYLMRHFGGMGARLAKLAGAGVETKEAISSRGYLRRFTSVSLASCASSYFVLLTVADVEIL